MQDDVLHVILGRLDSIQGEIQLLRQDITEERDRVGKVYLPRKEFEARHDDLKEDIKDLQGTIKDLNRRLYIGVGVALAVSALLPFIYQYLLHIINN